MFFIAGVSSLTIIYNYYVAKACGVAVTPGIKGSKLNVVSSLLVNYYALFYCHLSTLQF